MHLVDVSDPHDDRLTDYVRLRDVNLRKSLEARHGLFMAEGEKVIRRALRAGFTPRSLLLTQRRRDTLADVVAAGSADVPVYIVSEDVAHTLVGFDLHRGALASFHREPLPTPEEVLVAARSVVVLEDIVDHTNVGAIFRSVAGLGIDSILLAPRCADPLYRRSIKVSMGAVFTQPYSRLADWRAGLGLLGERGFTLLALTPDSDAVPLDAALAEVGSGRGVALLLGSEGDGLSARWRGQTDRAVRIPMASTLDRDVDSLNVTAASAIACYELARATRTPLSPG